MGEFAKHDYKIIAIKRKRTLKAIAILFIALSASMSIIGYIDTYERLSVRLKGVYEAVFDPKAQNEQFVATATPKLTNQEYLIQELEANFSKTEAFDIYTMLRACENKRLDNNAKYTNNNGTIDRGIFMINDYYHKEVSNDDAYNLEANIKAGIEIFKKRGFKEWSCGKSLGLDKIYNN